MASREQVDQGFDPDNKPEEPLKKGWGATKQKIGKLMEDFDRGDITLDSLTNNIKMYLDNFSEGIKGKKKE